MIGSSCLSLFSKYNQTQSFYWPTYIYILITSFFRSQHCQKIHYFSSRNKAFKINSWLNKYWFKYVQYNLQSRTMSMIWWCLTPSILIAGVSSSAPPVSTTALLYNSSGPESGCAIFVPAVSCADRLCSFVLENNCGNFDIWEVWGGINDDRWNHLRIFHIARRRRIHDHMYWNLMISWLVWKWLIVWLWGIRYYYDIWGFLGSRRK